MLRWLRWVLTNPRFDGKVVFITGASAGLGEQLTKDIVSRGAKKVIIAARRVQELERVRQETGQPDKVEVLQLDMAEPE